MGVSTLLCLGLMLAGTQPTAAQARRQDQDQGRIRNSRGREADRSRSRRDRFLNPFNRVTGELEQAGEWLRGWRDGDRDGDGIRNRDDEFPGDPTRGRQNLNRIWKRSLNDNPWDLDRKAADAAPGRYGNRRSPRDNDRDGDGVRDQRDRYPNNPRRQ